MKVFSVLMI